MKQWETIDQVIPELRGYIARQYQLFYEKIWSE